MLELLSTHPYAIIFAGLLLGGETVLLPALYFAATDVLNVWYVMAIMLAATMASDIFWYAIGRGILPRLIRGLVKKDCFSKANVFARVAVGSELVALFYSKFIYGTRIAAQIFCGIRRVHFGRYLLVNSMAVVALGALYYLIVSSSLAAIESLDNLQYKLMFVLVMVAAIAGITHFAFYRIIKERWSL